MHVQTPHLKFLNPKLLKTGNPKPLDPEALKTLNPTKTPPSTSGPMKRSFPMAVAGMETRPGGQEYLGLWV